MNLHTSRKISVLRFLAVASVVVYHSYPFAPGTFIVAPPAPTSTTTFVQGFISLALTRWALPFLGLVSGYLFFRTFVPTAACYWSKMRSRAHTLLVPFLIWSGVGVLFTLVMTISPFAPISAYWTVHSVTSALDKWLFHAVTYPLWFLQALMMCMVLSPLVYLAVKALRGWVLVLAVAWWVLGWQPGALWPWVSATAFPPFIVGAAIALLGWKTPLAASSSHGRAPARVAAACVAAWLAAAAVFTAYGHDLGRWTRAGLLPAVVLGMCAMWTLADQTRSRKPMEVRRAARGDGAPAGLAGTGGRGDRLIAAALSVAPLSFFVYATQEPALAVCKHIAERAESVVPPIVVYLAPPLVVIMGTMLAGLALRRLVPRAFAVATGGRVAEPAARTTSMAAGPHTMSGSESVAAATDQADARASTARSSRTPSRHPQLGRKRHELEIRLREVSADAEQGLTRELGNRVRKAVPEIQPRRVPAPAVPEEARPRHRPVMLLERGHSDLETSHDQCEARGGTRPAPRAPAVQDHAGLDERRRRDYRVRGPGNRLENSLGRTLDHDQRDQCGRVDDHGYSGSPSGP